jgi:hypothetical protein
VDGRAGHVGVSREFLFVNTCRPRPCGVAATAGCCWCWCCCVSTPLAACCLLACCRRHRGDVASEEAKRGPIDRVLWLLLVGLNAVGLCVVGRQAVWWWWWWWWWWWCVVSLTESPGFEEDPQIEPIQSKSRKSHKLPYGTIR